MDLCKVLSYFYGTLRSVRRNLSLHWSTSLQIMSLSLKHIHISAYKTGAHYEKSQRCCKGSEKASHVPDTQRARCQHLFQTFVHSFIHNNSIIKGKATYAQENLKSQSRFTKSIEKIVSIQNITLQIPDHQLQVEKKKRQIKFTVSNLIDQKESLFCIPLA